MSNTELTQVPDLVVTYESGINLARLLNEFAMDEPLAQPGREADLQFVLQWAQIFRLHGQLKLAHMFVINFNEYALEMAKISKVV